VKKALKVTEAAKSLMVSCCVGKVLLAAFAVDEGPFIVLW